MKSSRQFVIVAILFLQWLPVFADDMITNVLSPIASYQYPEDFSSEILTNGGVQSPFVSYQFLENLSSEALTSGCIMSPIASYQYYEWPGNGILNLQSSPTVSYYYQFLIAPGSVAVYGHVTDVNGTPLYDATVSAMVNLSPVALATTDANGNYQITSLGAGVYGLWAWDSTHQTSIRVLTLTGSMAEQDFQLQPFPPTPIVQQTTQQPNLSYTIGPMDSALRVFDGTQFVPIVAGENVPPSDRMTIVLTHGWIFALAGFEEGQGVEGWPTSLAVELRAQGINANIANIVAWDWPTASESATPAPALGNVPSQGVALGQALLGTFGANYSQPLHFIGHSMGAMVNAAAINYLRGDRTSTMSQEVSPTPWASTPIYVTVLDGAEAANLLSQPVLFNGLDLSLADAVNGGPSAENTTQNWIPSMPVHPTWADNYITVFGHFEPSAVNVWLQKGMSLNVESAHGYPIDWYNNSIANPTDINDPLGFQRSQEFVTWAGLPSSTFPPTDSSLQPGNQYWQIQSSSDPLALTQTSFIDQSVGNVAEAVVQSAEGTLQVAGNVTATIENSAQNADQLIAQDFNYVGNIASQGGQTVVNLANSAVLELYLSTAAVISQSSQSLASSPHPLGTPAGNGTTTSPPMVWVPITIPAGTPAMAFDFSVQGDPVDDVLVCGIGTNNLFTLQAKYIPTNCFSASPLIDVSAWAGTTNELFFGFLGGTSTNATLAIDNIRFYSVLPPSLQAQFSGNSIILAWPTAAQGFSLQTTTNLADPSSWVTLTNVPAIVNLQNTVTNSISGCQGFYRLIQSQ